MEAYFINEIFFITLHLYTMLKFDVTYTLPQHHFIDFTFYIDNNKEEIIKLHLPAWRPGRYEIGNFAQNIQQVKVLNAMEDPLPFEKITKDCWEIKCKGEEKIVVRYRCYANILNAGSTYLDEEQLYLNPVNCFIYIEERMHEEIQIQFIIPGNYHIATQLPKLTKHTLIAKDFDELADSPIIASASLKHIQYRVASTDFHIWFQGNVVLNEKKIIGDFVKFTTEQIKLFGDCECKDYLFLMQMLPVDFHHGVEHKNSSVNALGPGDKLMDEALYTDFLGLCSHELFHLWNVKRIRPKAMLPYNFKQENYCNMGYVYEGITTYYGDLVLFRSGVYSFHQFCLEINAHLQKHFHNYGRYNQNLADSSVDTWLDGYRPGIPDRKVNIYTEGLLAAMILDAHCISQTDAEYCMDDMLKLLYTDYYKKGIGYDEASWKACIESVTGHRYDLYFREVIHGCGYIEIYLPDALKQIGLKIKISESNILESHYGIKVVESTGKVYVQQIAPGSEAYSAGIAKDDLIISINFIPANTAQQLNEILKDAPYPVFTISRDHKIYEYTLKDQGEYFMKYELMMDEGATEKAKINFEKWSGNAE
jgi:predicted metalloprotease with PDZ domain